MLIERVVSVRRGALWATVVALIGLVLGFVVNRLVTDVPNAATGTIPAPRSFDHRYALHLVPAYLHIALGTGYLLGAPLQLARRFRARHLVLHRRLGRVLLSVGLAAGALAVVIGVWFPYGGALEASASVVFGAYFMTALGMAFLAIRVRDVARHRRWMIRAFAVALGVATIRIWLGLFVLLGLLSFQDDRGAVWFGAAFWLAFLMHALAAEVYLVGRPAASGRVATQPRGGPE